MKTLYTGHIAIDKNYIYSFIYAENLLEAETYLVKMLGDYMQVAVVQSPHLASDIQVVSRPAGWLAPDGYYLPATSTQYALRYSSISATNTPQETVSPATDLDTEPETSLPFSYTTLSSQLPL